MSSNAKNIYGLKNGANKLVEIDIALNLLDQILNGLSGITDTSNVSSSILYGAGVPTASINPFNGNNSIYIDTVTKIVYVCHDATFDNNLWVSITSVSSNITYGAGVPSVSINPYNGTNAIYVDTNTNTSYICKDATTNANVWVINGSGQFADIGTSIGKGVQFMAQVSGVEDIVVPEGTNAFSIESFVLESGATLTVPNGSVYKVL